MSQSLTNAALTASLIRSVCLPHCSQGHLLPPTKRFALRIGSLACTALNHCQRRAAGEPADEAGEDQLIEFAGNYGQSLDWIVLGDLDPTIRRLSAIGHDDDDPAVMVA